MEQQLIQISKLEVNKGQIEGLPQNPRFIRDTRFEQLKKSIEDAPEMLNLRELIVMPHGKKYVVIGGNMRLRACTDLGYKELPCKVLPADTPPEKLREYAIKDNNGFGQDDWDLLVNEWDDVELGSWGVEFPIDFATSGDEQPGKTTDDAKEDDFDENKDNVESRCSPGDLWLLGDHRLMCGDSTDSGSVALLMDGEKADMCFTDPPYGVSYANKNEYLNTISRGNRIQIPIENDHESPQKMHDFWLNVFNIIGEFTADCMAYYITAPQGGELLLLQAIQESETLALKHMLIWNKNNHVLGRCDYNYKHELIIYGWKKKGTHHFVGGSKFKTSVWDIPKPQKSELHPTMKPVELVSACLLDNSVERQSVLDLFGGSGTTMIAAEQLNRRCFMMELDPHYCDVIIARWEKLTGRKAEILTSKQ